MESLKSVYEPQAVEERLYRWWKESGFFKPAASGDAPPYSCVLPPPNVTGRLHMGHALTATVQDCLLRWKRMNGHDSLWLPGTDHAGIATQVMVERQLAKEGTDRETLGREKFLERVWAWKEEHGGIIDAQHEALGASLDWDRYRFTMDEVSSRAVREAFCRLHEEGLIYRSYRLINWDWGSQTALSDLEVEHKERDGHLWHIAYPVEGEDGTTLVVATTRPETMLGDTGVAVHPEDPRYKHLIGKHVILPLTGRKIPIVGDAILVDMEFGTGAVKVTPAHDFNDFETGKRHDLPLICVIDLAGKMNDNAPEAFRGMKVDEARAAVVKALEAEGRLVKIEDHKLSVGVSQRTGVVVEPLPSDQWFVNVQPLAKPALEAVREGKTVIYPHHRTADYYRWMENIHDWCISRQLWWGHRIPAWHCGSCGEITVAREDPTACKACGSAEIRQDPDVLDTWFSSGLWPLTCLGWPSESADLARFYPTALMETGWDILFFWVARMMMFGLKFGGEVPFKTVFLHSMVLGEDGHKMSKTRGNVVDPVELIDLYGADSLRFYLATMAGQDQGSEFSRARVQGYRNFCNKLWNAARFVRMNLEDYSAEAHRAQLSGLLDGTCGGLEPADVWILSRAMSVTAEVNQSLAQFRLDQAAHAVYQFVWHEYCDWYLELAKPHLWSEADPAARVRTQAVLVTVLDTILRLLHPIIPFITEEIWRSLPCRGQGQGQGEGRGASLMYAAYPGHEGALQVTLDAARVAEAGEDIERMIEIITAARALKATFKLSPGTRVKLLVRSADPVVARTLSGLGAHIERLARLSGIERLGEGDAAPKASATEVVRGVEVILPLEGVIDLDAERARLSKEIDKLTKDATKLDKKLGNENFLKKAPPAVVAKDKARRAEIEDSLGKLRATLATLAG